ncbi:MAG: sigma 54-interacting transcriptional regulator [Acidobacteria bacterium]|nr:sigma 54-interacting transcriptional regulator [Acidobacteriota bacterium]
MVVAVPLLGDRVAPRCTSANRLLLVQLHGRFAASHQLLPVRLESAVDLLQLIQLHDIGFLVCGGITAAGRELVEARNVTVIDNVTGSVEELLALISTDLLDTGFGSVSHPSPHRTPGAVFSREALGSRATGTPRAASTSAPQSAGLPGEGVSTYLGSEDTMAESRNRRPAPSAAPPGRGPVPDTPAVLRAVFESISEGMFTVDPDFVITSFNPAAERITGFAASEAVGRQCYEIFRTEVCHRQCPLREVLTSTSPVENVRVHIISQDGVEKPIAVSATALRERGEITGAVEFFRDLSEVEHLRHRLAQRHMLDRIVSESTAMKRVIETLPNIADSDCCVLITGPSGSGKELIAQAIHSLSPRRYGPYIRINCAALPATLLESELFGYMKGAFTDARKDKPGHFALANGGTLLLDEIGEMDASLQVKLLRVLNNGEYQPLGSTTTHRTDARVIASTNSDLQALIEDGRFRSDLYFRINVVSVRLPSLAERPEDIPHLIQHFLAKFRARTGKEIKGLSPSALRTLCRYNYPGNVRELENAVEHAFVMCNSDTIEPEHLPSHLGSLPPSTPANTIGPKTEKVLIREALERHGGNRSRAARELGMHRTTLWRKLKTYEI